MNLEKYCTMKTAIKECHENIVSEIESIKDNKIQYDLWLMIAKESSVWCRQAQEIKLRIERNAGKIITELQKKEIK